ncbi:peptidoglycan-binding domain-containing protein [Streptomyces sp. MMG1121]|uniref:peptidoglycan-binding domain-containing protein n=1 Tax=Streptomyces sp. MMG1121 TaxID=1415544 RepID=UPI0006AFF67D|nr:peptidoglycan-binding domain-containing protein [Streptomyces sp. MMG1121]KOV61351.1 hypothetical protein ADK64_28205 [Streptomyces sp. MMG1121]
MSLEQHINWTVLPAGLSDDGTQAKVSLFVAPRLLPDTAPLPAPDDPSATLSQFGDFINWPVAVGKAHFEFATADSATGPSTVFTGLLVPQGPAPDPTLWTSVFHGDTPLEPYVFSTPVSDEHSHAALRTYSVREVRDFTRKAYARAAQTWPEEPPSTWNALGAPVPAAPIDEGQGHDVDGPVPPRPPDLSALSDLDTFHSITTRRPSAGSGLETVSESAEADTNAPQTGPLSPPRPPDFHAILTSLGDHPTLLRRLGLVLDFLLPAHQLPASSGERLLTVVAHWSSVLGSASKDVPARTRYVFLADRHVFVPAAKEATPAEPLAPPSQGLVGVGAGEDYFLEQTDLDAAALGMLTASQQSTGLSPVRAHGISLIENGRKSKLASEFDQAKQFDDTFAEAVKQPSPVGPVLAADDVVRGHRMDIWDEGRRQWFSLHQRDVEYRLPNAGAPLLTVSDEGFFQAHLASPPDGSAPLVPEHLATWDGWSLSAHRPGLVLDSAPDEPGQPPRPPVEPKNEAGPGVPLEITVSVRPGSLPRLRFGSRYRVRLRTVDLAGNGLDLTQATAFTNPTGQAPADPKDLTLPAGGGLLTFQRFEAVPAPAVAPRLPFGEGASAYRMVIRSSPGPAPPPAAAPGATGSTQPVLLSRVQPQQTNDDIRIVQRALIAGGHHLPGGDDGFFGPDTRAAYAEEQRDQGFSGSDADGVPGCQSLTELGRKNGFTVDCGTGPAGPAAAGGTAAQEYAADFNKSPLVTEAGHAPYQGTDERHLVAPKGSLQCVERHGLLDEAIGSTDQNVQNAVWGLAVRESGSLSDVTGPDVRLVPITSPSADPAHPPTTALHTGERIELPYLPDPLSTGAVLLDLPGMPAGQPLFVPWDGSAWHQPQSFRLVLAEGSGPPRFDDASRVLTVSLPQGVVATVRVCSGIKLDGDVMGLATWCQDAVQDPVHGAPEPQAPEQVLALAAAGRHWMFTPWQELTLVHAVQQPLRTPVLNLRTPPPPRPDHATAQQLAGTIALDEGTTDRIDLVAQWTEVTDAGPAGRNAQPMTAPVFGLLTARANRTGAPGAAPVVLQDGLLTFDTGAAATGTTPPDIKQHEFGDTKHRTVRYSPLAGSSFGDYFPAQFADPGRNDLSVQGAAQELSVLSSAPPTAPRLLYCMPTLSLERADGPSGALVQRRHGGGVRVYLDRPWYSSGDGELLGVVLGRQPGGDPTSVQDAWVTLMGRDPVHRSAPVVAPTADVFTHAEQPRNVSLTTPSGPLPVTVVGFTPQFDADGQGGRWFCDLELDTGDACLPFVRLALVRYQPDSIPGAEISSVVLADLVRVLPDRELTVTLGQSISVSLTGPSWDPTGSAPPLVTATLQRRHDVVTDDDLGWVTLEDTVTQLTSIDAESSHRPFYTGQVPVPPVPPGMPLRLLVMETEGIRADGSTPPAPSTPTTPPGPVLYCDTVDLPPRHGGDDHDDHDDHGGFGHH